MPTQQEKIGAYVAALRKAKQMTQADLGERCQVSCQAISKWERGECLPDTLTAEVIIQELKHGKYVDLAEVDRLFTNPKWKETIARYANAYGIK